MTEPTPLSEREKEVLQLVAEGLTNREISQRLSISPNTVKVHLRNIFEKAGVASRTEATVYAIEQRIVAVPGGEVAPPEGQTGGWGYVRVHPWVGFGGLFLVVALILTIFFAFVLPAREPEVDPTKLERWQELAPMPEARVGLAAVAYDSQIYAIAGEGPTGVSGSVFRYDIETDTWERLLDKPIPVTDVKGVLIGEKIYVPGGAGRDGQPVNSLEIYDPRHNTWETGAPLPEALSAYALADFEGKMYLFGGWDGEKAVDTVLLYDPSDDSWHYGTAMSIERYKAGAVEAGGKIFIIGGKNDLGNLIVNESYSPQREMNSENPWNFEAPVPKDINNVSVQGVGDLIFIMGENQHLERVIMIYSISNAEWDYLSVSVEQFKEDAAITSLGGYLWFLGGENNKGEILSNTLQFKAIYTILLPIVN